MNSLTTTTLINTSNAISPIDGRYASKTAELQTYFSEYSLNKYRMYVEIKYLIALSNYKILTLDSKESVFLNSLYQDFSVEDNVVVKEIESVTNHDVKAIEYFIREKVSKLKNKTIENHIHFGLTSQDINSSANMLGIKNAVLNVIIPNIETIMRTICHLIEKWGRCPLLSMTHGQPASPTIFSKELLVFYERIIIQVNILEKIKYTTKFGGAVGNFNAHYVSYPDINWVDFANVFVKNLGLKRNKFTTQIDHYDNYSEIFDCVKRINVICIDMCQDMWLYISRNVLTQKINKEEVGSSAMPHKVNPINFENAEGNFLLANAMLELFSRKLPVSRLQRDLTDSTLIRNVGSAFSYTLIALKSLQTGLSKIDINRAQIKRELNNNYIVIAEAIQTKMKVLGIENSYEKIKEITRKRQHVTQLKIDLSKFINNLDISDTNKQKLLEITPFNYVGKFR